MDFWPILQYLGDQSSSQTPKMPGLSLIKFFEIDNHTGKLAMKNSYLATAHDAQYMHAIKEKVSKLINALTSGILRTGTANVAELQIDKNSENDAHAKEQKQLPGN